MAHDKGEKAQGSEIVSKRVACEGDKMDRDGWMGKEATSLSSDSSNVIGKVGSRELTNLPWRPTVIALHGMQFSHN